MPEPDAQAQAQAEVHFERARQATEAGDFDRAIDAYMEGLRRSPDTVEGGHIDLRVLALRRDERGGAKPSPEEIEQRLREGDTPLEKMLNAEYLLAKDPQHLAYGEAVLRAAVAGRYRETAKWMADLMFLANNNAKKPSPAVYILLKDSYEAIGQIDRAAAACQRALRLKPNDAILIDDLKRLAGRLGIHRADGTGAPVATPHPPKGRPTRTRVNAAHPPQAQEPPEPASQGEPAPPGPSDQGDLAAARTFFEKARAAAESKNYDYAIEMYLDGLQRAPDALEEGHLPLCELGLQRRGRGGKKPSMVDRVKRLRGRTPLEQMLNAEYLFAKDPDHTPYAEAMLKAAVEGGYHRTAHWIANLIFQTNNAIERPSLQTYLLLKECYKAMGQYDKAVAACQRAVRMRPDDKDLADEFKNLSAELTMSRGKYDVEGDFRQSIRDRDTQARLYSQDRMIKTEDYRLSAVEEARTAYAKDPGLAKNIFTLADALADLETDDAENEAIQLLRDAAEAQKDFQFQERAGLLRIRQIRRKLRAARKQLKTRPSEPAAQARVRELTEALNRTETEHYRLCVENHPTDLSAKYEYGLRLMRNERYNEAIPLFQDAQKDPRRRISAMDKIGYCFFMKGWYADAIDVFSRAIDSYEIKDDAIAKELRYNLARAHESQGDLERALELYRRIAQLDFGYKDVSERVDRLRADTRLTGSDGPSGGA
ncbi:tetratricopeptide repeat protein [Anaerobaca lacustris]|uniref:Tetratricopeptide repeat protein n=1 Tax=Anaerobaca lacustris TaxID=3044600 RepID=A0AAW6TVB3_9BACT|nr:tetratricopeptide repeat protein [Sedimentisphaerales bacterium M17dextr]